MAVKNISFEKLSDIVIDQFSKSQLLVLSLNQLRYISVEQIIKLSANGNIVLNPDQLAALGYCNNHCSIQEISICRAY